MFQKLACGIEVNDAEMEQMFRVILDPELFEIKDGSLATVAKLSREFGEVLEGEFFPKGYTKKMVRKGVVNVTIDTKKLKAARLMVNFGIDVECTDVVPYDGVQGQDLLNLLNNAKHELLSFVPPVPTLECSYREYLKAGRRMLTKVRFISCVDCQNDEKVNFTYSVQMQGTLYPWRNVLSQTFSSWKD